MLTLIYYTYQTAFPKTIRNNKSVRPLCHGGTPQKSAWKLIRASYEIMFWASKIEHLNPRNWFVVLNCFCDGEKSQEVKWTTVALCFSSFSPTNSKYCLQLTMVHLLWYSLLRGARPQFAAIERKWQHLGHIKTYRNLRQYTVSYQDNNIELFLSLLRIQLFIHNEHNEQSHQLHFSFSPSWDSDFLDSWYPNET